MSTRCRRLGVICTKESMSFSLAGSIRGGSVSVGAVSAQATTQFIKELVAGDLIVIDGAATRIGGRSVTFHLRMLHADTGALHATYDLVEVFFDPEARASAPIPAAVRAKLESCLVAPD